MLRPIVQDFTVIATGMHVMLLPGKPAEYGEDATAKMVFTNGQRRACVWTASWGMMLSDLRTFVRGFMPGWDLGV